MLPCLALNPSVHRQMPVKATGVVTGPFLAGAAETSSIIVEGSARFASLHTKTLRLDPCETGLSRRITLADVLIARFRALTYTLAIR